MYSEYIIMSQAPNKPSSKEIENLMRLITQAKNAALTGNADAVIDAITKPIGDMGIGKMFEVNPAVQQAMNRLTESTRQ